MTQWQDFTYSSTDGLVLAGRKYGWQYRDAMPVVCLSGLSRNASDFHDLAMHLSTNAETKRRVLCLDYRGRGQSDYDKHWENYSIFTEADDVIQAMTAAGLEHASFIGTSRGGLIIMLLAAMKPTLLASVVMNDIGPEIDGPGLVRIKKMLESSSEPASNWKEAAETLKQLGQFEFPLRDDTEWEKQARLIYTEKNGKLIKNYDPNLVNTMKAIDLDSPLPDMWPQFTGLRKIPLMLIRGDNTHLLAENTVRKMQEIHPTMSVVKIADQGHAPDLGGAGLPQKIDAFLDKNT